VGAKTMKKKNSIITKWTEPDNLELLSSMASYGCTDKDIAKRMGISVQSFYRYRSQSPELDEAIRNGKEVIDYKVESALLKAALGSVMTETKLTLTFENDILVRTVKETITRETPPNVLACQTWLFNRQRDKWKRNRDNEIDSEGDQSISITIKHAGTLFDSEAE